MLKKLLMSLFIIFMILYTTISYAVSVTKENLNEAFQEFVLSDANEKNFKVELTDNTINITSNEGDYELEYDLTDKPTFTITIPIEKGMSYKEFEKRISNLNLPMLGYIAVANIQGIEIADAATYFLFSYLQDTSFPDESSYVIIDDLQEGTTIEEEDNAKIIYASEFGDRVMDYVNEIYKDKQTMTDSTGINSYVYTTEKKETTENSCKLVTTLSINLDADFSKINEYSNQLSAEVLNKDITEENADYVIRLKVGQKCNIKSEKKIVGYETYGSNCIEFNEEKNVMTAVGTGIANGYLYVGDNTNKKSFYVIVEENASNQILEPVNITISNTSNNNNPNANKNVKTTVPKTTLPKAGNSKILFALLFIAAIVLAIILGAKNRKFKDIK